MLYEVITKVLGLSGDRGHLGVGAKADISIYEIDVITSYSIHYTKLYEGDFNEF